MRTETSGDIETGRWTPRDRWRWIQVETETGRDGVRWAPRDRWRQRQTGGYPETRGDRDRWRQRDRSTWGQEEAERQTDGHPETGGDGDSWRWRREEVNRLGVVVGVERSL